MSTTYAAFARETAIAAGALILPHFRAALDVADKGAEGEPYDPVTVADHAAEALIRERIAQVYPDHGIRGEEHGWQKGSSNFTWVIDPIDGTRSFILGQLHWATLIALNDGERVVAGLAYQPYIGESFAAADGEAWWQRGSDRRRLATRRCSGLSDAVLAGTDPGMFRTPGTLDAFERVAGEVRLRRWGGDCYCYCLLAMGLIDVVIESSLQAYDVQALIPIVEAAGGVMTDWSGNRCDEGGSVVACGDRALHDRVLSLLSR